MDLQNSYRFPGDFIWGAATASYQIEGAYDEDGRGLSTWDVFSRLPGKVRNGDTGDVACDHYHRYKEDVALMKELGLKHYRFSVAWPRILPEGEGEVNQKGLDFYSDLVDELLAAGIEPLITLFHWDLPQALQDKYEGWGSRRTAELFADYTRIVVRHLGDRVKRWATINEIMCFTTLAHREDQHAPGGKRDKAYTNQTVHNALLGHGMALKVIKEECPQAQVGIVENLMAPWPYYRTEEDLKAARKAWKDMNGQRLMPLFTGVYDEEAFKRAGEPLPKVEEGDMELISQKMDYIAYNYYSHPPVRAAQNEWGFELVQMPEAFSRTDMDWPITPEALYWSLIFTKELFGDIPIYIAENGMAAADKVEEDGSIQDGDRVEFLRNHLRMCHKAIEDGVNLKGYYVWSFMDNFEWAFGYSKRFGIVRVEYDTQKRTVKESGRYYSLVIKENRVL
ncbi:MAG: GH1 family beta-glucosidase [Spirochaetales bacterium]|nr:GH1 family beta-glucosidase [Spirochaetales bacterium]